MYNSYYEEGEEMNELMFLRNILNENTDYNDNSKKELNYLYNLYFFKNLIKEEKALTQEEIRIVKTLDFTHYDSIDINEIYDLVKYIGENIYFDSYMGRLIHKNIKSINNRKLKKELKENLELFNREKLMTTIKIITENKLKLFKDEETIELINNNLEIPDILNYLIYYSVSLKLTMSIEIIFSLLNKDIEYGIKIGILFSLYFYNLEYSEKVKEFVKNKEEYEEIAKLFNCLEEERLNNKIKRGITAIAFMFYGDPITIGIGNSGGLGIFLKNLGDELSFKEEINKIYTIVLLDSNKKNKLPLYE